MKEEGEKASPSCTMDQKKKKGSNTSVNSKNTVDNRVVLNVGMISKN